jgi:type II secretion system protein G
MKKFRGFTLIELLVVIGIIGILAVVVIAAMSTARGKARDDKRISDVRSMMVALELFYSDNARYPTATSNLPTPADGSPAFNSYLAVLPDVPVPNDGDCTPANNAYVYAQTNSGKNYSIVFCLGNSIGDYAPGVHTASSNGIK